MGREIKRVDLDFDWPLDKVWEGYLTPDDLLEAECTDCGSTGYSEMARQLRDRWYGYVPFDPSETGSTAFTVDTPQVRQLAERNVESAPWYYGSGEAAIVREAQRLADIWNGSWSHHLAQEDVDALVADERLRDFTHTWSRENGWQPKDPAPQVTAEEVNLWSLGSMGHDGINSYAVVKARCERAGFSERCSTCHGHGTVEAYPGQRKEQEDWEPIEPPAGEGWQVWETVSEGSPISPVFAEREGLIGWLTSPAYKWGISRPLTREQAENFTSSAWAPTLMFTQETGLVSGDAYVPETGEPQ